MTAQWSHCVVVGTGLLGASLAGAGKARGLFARTTGVGRSTTNLETARARRLVDDTTSHLASAVADADLVVLATPVQTALRQLGELTDLLPAHCAVTDVGSVKAPIVAEAARLGLSSRFLGAHPMAGKAESGAGAADVDLFRGARVVLTPDSATPESLTAAIRAMWTALDAEVVVMNAAEHDEAVAMCSHLPQMVAYALAAAADDAANRDRVLQLAAGGFRDMTRLAASDADMWLDIITANREPILEALSEMELALGGLQAAIEEGDETWLRAVFAKAQKLRGDLPR
ncbi:MAG TPA: prephenate dehydrogenase/arogenate dehydrogenase family protein [Candidatus Limnocylindrales bacterium]|nr:prephenate dehydrogenase/arogenate dehydrogenase family protein [Candidatus Limnocylindrales bacterium]